MKRKRNKGKKPKDEVSKQAEELKREDRIVYAILAVIVLIGILICFFWYQEMRGLTH